MLHEIKAGISSSVTPANILKGVSAAVILVVLYLLSAQDYLLFHSIIELATIAIAFSIFIIVWNTRKAIPETFFLIIGISFLFTGSIDLIHTLAFKGMGVFPESTADLPTQIWIAARYFQSITFFIATLFIGKSITKDRKHDVEIIFAACAAACILILASIFVWQNFPHCFIEGSGLTPFKIASEYVISLILVATIIVLWTRRRHFDRDVWHFLIAAQLFLILGELAFTSYISVYGFMNMLGHLFKLISFYFFYRAIVVVALTRPYDLLLHELKVNEETVRESREMYRQLVENINDVIFSLDLQGNFTYISPVIERLYGYTPDETIGQHFSKFIHPEDHPICIEAFKKRLKGEYGLNEFRIIAKDGRTEHVLISQRPIIRDDAVCGFNYILTNITARKQAEEAMLESEARLRTLVQTIPDLIWLKDTNGVYLACNSMFERFFGAKESLIVGKTDYDFVDKKLADFFREHDRIAMAAGGPSTNEEWITFADNGHRAMLETIKTPMYEKDGRLIGVLGIGRDITGRKQAEEAVRESERKFRDIFNNTTDAIHIHEINTDGTPGKFTDVNEVTCRILGYSREEILEKTPPDIATEHHDPPIAKILEEQRTRGVARFETGYRTKDGEIIPVEINTHVVTLQGRKVMLGVVRDMTEHKKAEALLKDFNEELQQQVKAQTEVIQASLDEKVLLLREIHHRVKNNLQIIISLVNLQMRQIDDDRLKQVMKETQNRVRAMSFVHEKLYQSEDIAHIDLANYTRFMVNQLFSFYGVDSRQVALEIDIGKIMLRINTAIPLGLIINELASNALKHAFADGRTGTLSISAREENKTLSLTIKSDGIPIPPDLDWRNAESLGLRLVISLVDQLDGTIELDRSSGTAFTIIVKEKD
ncbi:MAG: MASE3 domain-containing protein [Methanoregula sp.]